MIALVHGQCALGQHKKCFKVAASVKRNDVTPICVEHASCVGWFTQLLAGQLAHGLLQISAADKGKMKRPAHLVIMLLR